MHQQGEASPAHPQPGPRACRCLRNANAMNWGRVPTRLFSGICFPLSPLPIPLQTLPPPPATCSFHEPITMARLFFSSKPLALLTRHRCSRASPCCPRQSRTPSRQKKGWTIQHQLSPQRRGRPQRAIWLQVVSERDLPRAVESWWISEAEQGT